jgi:predicted nuclease with TOPRIM domain
LYTDDWKKFEWHGQQEAMMELQEQIQSISITKEKVVKEKSKMQSEIAELIAKIEILSQEKTSIRKVVEKLEIQVSNLHNFYWV